eukprot:6180495-Heterocapsa_arctica.AAC.1
MNSMRKYQMLVNNKQEYYEEGQTLHYKLEGTVALEHLKAIEARLDEMRTNLRIERPQRGKKGNGPLIVSNGGSAQMKDIMKLAEEPWGGLWVVEAEDLNLQIRKCL